jgi:hypothetical protein
MNQSKTYFQDLAPLSHANKVGATHEELCHCTWGDWGGGGAGACPGVDVVPRWPKSCQAYCHDSVMPTAMARLTSHMPYNTWVLVG